jgi:hypothetical protein
MKLRLLSAAVACSVVMSAAPALAQGVSGALFGAMRPDTSGRDKLHVQLSTTQAVDSEVPPEFRSFVRRNDSQSGGHSTVLAGSADFARVRPRVQLFGNAATYFRYVPRFDRVAAGSQSAQLGAGVRLPRRGTLQITQGAAYSPSYLYELFPTATPLAAGDMIPTNPDYRSDQNESYSYNTRTALAFGSPRETRLTMTANYGVTDFKDRTIANRDLVRSAAGARLSHALSRSAAFSFGYEYSVGEFGSSGTTKAHRGTIGVEYTPSLSVSRRATFRLDVSPTIVEIPASPLSAVEPRVYPLQGEASLEYPFRLKWRATASYRRSVNYVAVLREPLLANGAVVKLAGLIGRRVDLAVSGGYASAVTAASRYSQNLDTFTGEARIRYALTRGLALYSEYLYYYYDLGEQAHLAAGIPSVYKQRGVRVGVTLFGDPLGR